MPGRHHPFLAAAACLFLAWAAGALPAAQPAAGDPAPPKGEQARTDQHGDPLPAGAIARLGTVRLRECHTVIALALSPDGKVLASAAAANIGLVHLWDTATGKEIRELPALGGVTSLAFSPDGKWLAFGDAAATVHVCNAAAGEARQRLWGLPDRPDRRGERDDHPGLIRFVAFAADSKTLTAGSTRGAVRAWEIPGGKELRQVKATKDLPAETLAVSRNGTAQVWREHNKLFVGETVADKAPRRLGCRQVFYPCAAFSPDGRTVATAGGSNGILLSDVATAKVIRRFEVRSESLGVLAFSPDSTTLAAGDADAVYLWDTATGAMRRRLPGHASVTALAFSADGKVLVSGGGEGMIRLWRTSSGEDLCPTAGHQAAVGAVALASDARIVTVSAGDRTTRVWEAATGRELRRLEAHSHEFREVALAAGGDRVAWLRTSGEIRVLALPTGQELRRLPWEREDDFRSLAFSADGRLLLAGATVLALTWSNMPRTLVVWDVATGKPTRVLEAPDLVRAAAISPDGATLVTTDLNTSTIRLWRLATGKEVRQALGHRAQVIGTVFSPDSRAFVSWGSDTTLRLWEVATGRQRWQTRIAAEAAAFSPDGRILATAYHTHLFFWDVATGREIHRWQGHRNRVHALAFSPDGKRLVSGSADTTALVWDVARMLPPRVAREVVLPAGEPERLWGELANRDPVRANPAVQALACAPGQAVALLQERLRPVPPGPPPGIERMIADLGSERFPLRTKAAADLEKLGERAEPALRKLLAGGPPLEVRRRAEQLLDRLERQVPSPERLRVLRAVEVLEQIGTPEARKLLEALARGAPEASLTREAQASLRRLARQP
jgi:WD40 repeat protein